MVAKKNQSLIYINIYWLIDWLIDYQYILCIFSLLPKHFFSVAVDWNWKRKWKIFFFSLSLIPTLFRYSFIIDTHTIARNYQFVTLLNNLINWIQNQTYFDIRPKKKKNGKTHSFIYSRFELVCLIIISWINKKKGISIYILPVAAVYVLFINM